MATKDKAEERPLYPHVVGPLKGAIPTPAQIEELEEAVGVVLGEVLEDFEREERGFRHSDHAQAFLHDLERLLQDYHARHVTLSTYERAVASLRAMAHVSYVDRTGAWFPNHLPLAEIILRDRRDPEDFDRQVVELAAKLNKQFDGWRLLPDDPYEAIKAAYAVAGRKPANLLAAEKMRAHRRREKLGEATTGRQGTRRR